MNKLFLVLYSPGPAWIPGLSIFEQHLESHGNYVWKLHQEGKAKMGGPFLDSSGGATLLELEGGIEEARAIAEHDPCVISGIMTVAVHPWHTIKWEQYGQKQL